MGCPVAAGECNIVQISITSSDQPNNAQQIQLWANRSMAVAFEQNQQFRLKFRQCFQHRPPTNQGWPDYCSCWGGRQPTDGCFGIYWTNVRFSYWIFGSQMCWVSNEVFIMISSCWHWVIGGCVRLPFNIAILIYVQQSSSILYKCKQRGSLLHSQLFRFQNEISSPEFKRIIHKLCGNTCH